MKLTTEEFKVLVEANNIYLFDWRENDEDEKSAGWRHPVYFIELRKPFDYSRLVDAGLMEKRTFSFYETYRITELGMNAIKELEAPAASDTGSGADELPTEQDLYEAFFQDKTYGAVKALFDQLQAQLAAAEEREKTLRAALKTGCVLADKVMAQGGIGAIQLWSKDVKARYFAAQPDAASDSP